jgi:hypothetical protein
MDQRNEGDEIILFSFAQIGCKLGDSISSLSQLSPEDIVKLVTRALFVISQGDIVISDVLPANLASRHRICTDIAGKVKDLGYLGDCGYNQLLYPTPAQTRSILNWLMQKLPRTEDVSDVAVSLSALFAKRISSALVTRKKCWMFDYCAVGQPLVPLGASNSYPSTVVNLNNIYRYPFGKYRILPEASILEFHQLLLTAEEKTNDLDDLSESNFIDSKASSTAVFTEHTKSIIRAAFGQQNEDGFFGNEAFGQGLLIEKDLATKSLSELINFIENENSVHGITHESF